MSLIASWGAGLRLGLGLGLGLGLWLGLELPNREKTNFFNVWGYGYG